METLLIVALFAAFGGFVVSIAAMYKLLFSKNN